MADKVAELENLIEYRNAAGDIRISVEDKCFWGKIVSVNGKEYTGLAYYDGENYNDFVDSFIECVDCILEDLEESK